MPQKPEKQSRQNFSLTSLIPQAQPKKQPNKLKPMNPNNKIMPKTDFIEPDPST